MTADNTSVADWDRGTRELHARLLEAWDKRNARDFALLRANTGLIPPGKDDIDPALNAVQSMVAVRKGGAWKIALFQNTPAAFHERPDAVKKLTEELRAKLRERSASK